MPNLSSHTLVRIENTTKTLLSLRHMDEHEIVKVVCSCLSPSKNHVSSFKKCILNVYRDHMQEGEQTLLDILDQLEKAYCLAAETSRNFDLRSVLLNYLQVYGDKDLRLSCDDKGFDVTINRKDASITLARNGVTLAYFNYVNGSI